MTDGDDPERIELFTSDTAMRGARIHRLSTATLFRYFELLADTAILENVEALTEIEAEIAKRGLRRQAN
jgi:hypothetical protein